MNKSKLHTFAAIATIIATIIAGIQFYSSRAKSSDPIIPFFLQEKANDITIDTAKIIYQKEFNWLLTKYRAAKAIPYQETKSDALRDLAEQAVRVGDYNMAILAASEIPYQEKKRDALFWIVKKAVNDSSNFAYSVIAAEKIPYYETKKDALLLIVSSNKK